ncbi:MAG: 50S ribosomal protein L29 [Candidatus Marsarchaeota archaeon]|jgi:large subunit ribosomal protein L29|nr:50S ribosomal protein L29 [Candidatus Marsarchaeota archaeon]
MTNAKELRSLSNDALSARLGELRLEIAVERRKIASTGVSSKKVKLKEMKKTIARVMTILKERGAVS